MKNSKILPIFGVLIISCPAALSQGISEMGGNQAMSAGLGAGLAASLGNSSKTITRSCQSLLKAQQATLLQTKAIQQYMQFGCQSEAKKRWDDAEKSFRYVLQVIARKDGPGSVRSVPVLEHLVTVSKAQNKLDQAADFQETVLRFKTASPSSPPDEIVKAQISLTELLLQNNNYHSAEPVLQNAVSYCDAHPTVSPKKKKELRLYYAKVLRKLNKNERAQAIETADLDDTSSMKKQAGDSAAVEKPVEPLETNPVSLKETKN